MGILQLTNLASSKTADSGPVKASQSNSTTAAALIGVLAAAGAGVSGVIKATGMNSKTTPEQAAVIISVLLFAAVGVIAVAWVLAADYKVRTGLVSSGHAAPDSTPPADSEPAPAGGTSKHNSTAKPNQHVSLNGTSNSVAGNGHAGQILLKIVDEQAELPVLAARYDAKAKETLYLVLIADSSCKWVSERKIKKWVTMPSAGTSSG